MPPIALVRPVPDSFARAVTSVPADPPLDTRLAREQHAAYCRALAAGGFEVVEVAVATDHPDSAFIEDTAVVIGGRALVTRPGHPSRRGEVAVVAAALAERTEVTAMEAPATLDGGDVLVVGDRVFVGRSSRTNDEGIDTLSRFCAPLTVIPVPVHGVLHLQSAATAIDDETVLVHPDSVGPGDLADVGLVAVPGDDPEAANVLRLPDGSILAAAHHPATAVTLRALGHQVVTVDVSEFARADGGLTCLCVSIGE